MQSAAIGTGCKFVGGVLGRCQRRLGGDRDKAIQLCIELLDTLEVRFGQLESITPFPRSLQR